MAGQDFTTPQRFDLEPDPQPAISDILEGVAVALQAAVELAEPERTSARTLTLLTRIQSAASGHVDADELLKSLRRLVADWRA